MATEGKEPDPSGRGDTKPAHVDAAAAAMKSTMDITTHFVLHQEALKNFVDNWVEQQEELLDNLKHHKFKSGEGKSLRHSHSAEEGEGWLGHMEHAVENGFAKVGNMLAVVDEPEGSAKSQGFADVAHVSSPHLLKKTTGDLETKAVRRKIEKEVEMFHEQLAKRLDNPLVTKIAQCLTLFFRIIECLETHWLFNTICALVILANTVVLAVGTEMAMQKALVNDTGPDAAVYGHMEMTFCLCYVVELLVKIIAQRAMFLQGKDKMWNVFDLLLTASSVQEQVSALMPGDGAGVANMSYLRVVRLAKTLKLLRVIRLMRAFRELRMVLDSVMGSMKAMFWTMLLIAAILFMFGIAFVQASTEFLSSAECMPVFEGDLDNLCGEVFPSVEYYWGSIGFAMLSLFMATTGGEDWGAVAGPLVNAGVHYYFIFLVYIVFFLFVIMNALTSIFVDAAMVNSAKDEEQVVAEQMAQKKKYMEQVSGVFAMLGGGDAELTQSQFMEHIEDPALEAFAANLEIDSSDLEQFFNILSSNGTRGVNLETFVVGCIKLRGMAKSMDLMDMMLTLKRHIDESSKFQKGQEESVKRLKTDVGFLQTSVQRLAKAQSSKDPPSTAQAKPSSEEVQPTQRPTGDDIMKSAVLCESEHSWSLKMIL